MGVANEYRVLSCFEVRQWRHGRGGVQKTDDRQGHGHKRPSRSRRAAEGNRASGRVRRQCARPHGEAYRENAQVSEKDAASDRDQVRHTDHRRSSPANAKTGKMPSPEELAKWQRVTPIMNELLQARGMKKVAEGKVLVTGLKGPLEEGWQKKVEAFAAQVQDQV
jgi:hypothetical protein